MGCDGKQQTGPLGGRIAVVTGASSGIGRAIALALARQGAQICAVGRNPAALAETLAAVQPFSSITAFQIDLTSDESLEPLVRHLTDTAGSTFSSTALGSFTKIG